MENLLIMMLSWGLRHSANDEDGDDDNDCGGRDYGDDNNDVDVIEHAANAVMTISIDDRYKSMIAAT